ncbi:sensor histidine kinase [Paenibacillus mendelii]|uniref:histidine kinase n=1 Tax=Paenibacillus mendelii TaxID=206163 RepID=A0ABV6JIP9_9BACL|nr:sensor histidine kinase [Paenibacillus mendelii]MCQ6558712.1 sensor histidine kinase [Paenibacillus mendelii]
MGRNKTDVEANTDEPLTAVKPLRYIQDRLSYIAAFAAALLLSETALILGALSGPGDVDPRTAVYAGVLAFFCLSLWLGYDYIRQRAYYRQLEEARRHASVLDAALRVRSGVMKDQIAVQQLLQTQYEAYMHELGGYRRQQEMHHHFIHQWVHQMKTPVAVIDLIVQQADHGESAANTRSDLSSIREETERLTRGLDMMLSTARLEKFEMDVHIRRISLHELVRQVTNTYKRLCIKHSIFPQIIGEAEVETDEKWIAFVVHQLVGNAVKYSKPKPGTKKLLLQIDRSHEGSVTLHITDEGIGIAEHELPRIFDPFYTGQNGRLVEESTGMGLYLAKQVCSKLGHRLSVKSEPGSGTTISVSFQAQTLHKLVEE